MDNPAVTNAESWIRFFNTLRNISAALVAIGVLGEFLGDFLSEPHRKTVEDSRDFQITALNTRALEAEATIKKLSQPRSLNNEQADNFVKNFRSFPKKVQSIFVAGSPPTFESVSFASEIIRLLRSSGFAAEEREGFVSLQIGLAKGVVVQYVSGNDAGKELAEAIAGAFVADDIAASASPFTGFMENSAAGVPPAKRQEANWSTIGIAVGDRN